MAESGFTISSTNKPVRDFWIDHIKRARKISSQIGTEQGATCVHNLWVPDGMKNTPFDRWTNRKLLEESLDEIYSESYDASTIADAVESKLFGLGSEAYVVGSHEFYMGYAMKNKKMVCLDTGHFHPTETISDKLSAVLQFTDKVLMHVSRGVRWDSDHVVTFNDDVKQIMAEIVAGDALDKVYIALDYFDGSINRTCAYVSGMRSTIKSLLCALLMPAEKLSKLQSDANYGSLLSMLEGLKGLPWNAVWDMYCLRQNVPCGIDWIGDAEDYLAKVSAERK
jgi:L-rhamnose isomerase